MVPMPYRFEAKAQWPGTIPAVVGSLVVMCAGVVGIKALGGEAARMVMPFFILTFVAAYGLVLARMFKGRRVTLDVTGDRIIVDETRGGVFPLAGSTLGLWRTRGTDLVTGSALHLYDGQRFYRIGGRDHRPAPGTQLTAPTTESIDAYVEPAAFDALLRLVPVPQTAYVPGAPTVPRVHRCELIRNPATASAGFGKAVPWFVAMGLASVIGVGVGALSDVLGFMVAQYLALGLIVPILIGGLVLTVIRANQKKEPEILIEIDGGELRIRDVRTQAMLGSAPIAAIRVARSMHRTTGRMTFEYAVMTLQLPGQQPLAFCVSDIRYSWNDGAPFQWFAPRYAVGGPDWNLLAQMLGVARFLARSE
jgi:hypothetical protein